MTELNLVERVQADDNLRHAIGEIVSGLIGELHLVPADDEAARQAGGRDLSRYLFGSDAVPPLVPRQPASPLRSLLGGGNRPPQVLLPTASPPPALPNRGHLRLAHVTPEAGKPMSEATAPIAPETIAGTIPAAEAPPPVTGSGEALSAIEKQFNLRLAATIMQLMSEANVSVEEVASQTGMSPDNVQGLLLGRRVPQLPLHQAVGLLTALGASRVQGGWTPVLVFAPPAKAG